MNKITLFSWLTLIVMLPGCNQQDTDVLTSIGKKVQHRAETATGDIRSKAASSWHTSGDIAVEGRVAARLHWDKELADATIEVVAAENGIELRGKVRNLEQHRRAIMLAESTAGVESLKDSLAEGD